jgi:hypothetical protein
MSKKIFAIRLSLYILFGLVLPVGFLAWRFQLFSKVTKISFSIWGFIAIFVTAVFLIKLFNGVKKGMKPCLGKQVMDIICKVTIPLVLVTFAFDWLSGFSTEFVQFLVVLTICESIGGIVNPLPQWRFENGIETKSNMINDILEKTGIVKK